MYITLSKKIAIPNNVNVRSLAWSISQGFVACGGDEGLLKVLKLEAAPDEVQKGLSAATTLTTNQTLEGHSGKVQKVTWNERYQKLTSSDENGMIIVWMYFKGNFYEEMVNSRQKSVVSGMKWSANGQQICIAYEDGAVIVGTVDGNRIWGKELKGVQLVAAEWSPDSKSILFGTSTGEVHMYGQSGSFIQKLTITCLKGSPGKLIDIKWHPAGLGLFHSSPAHCPALIIAYDNGRCQLMKDANDVKPISLDTGLTICTTSWSHDGALLAIGGQLQKSQEKDVNIVQIYSCWGEQLRVIRVPGKLLVACAWERGAARLAIGIDYFIYFASVRCDIHWAQCGNALIYEYKRSEAQPLESPVAFWDLKTNEKSFRSYKSIVQIVASPNLCCIISRESRDPDPRTDSSFSLQLCNQMGSTLESKSVKMPVQFAAMNDDYVVVASRQAFYAWHFANPKRRQTAEIGTIRKTGFERIQHVDDEREAMQIVAGGQVTALSNSASQSILQAPQEIDFSKVNRSTNDAISCVALSEQYLFIGRDSSKLLVYSLPLFTIIGKVQLASQIPTQIRINCDSTRIAVIDSNFTVQLYKLNVAEERNAGADGVPQTKVTGIEACGERKEVWNVLWAEDEPRMCAVMEKVKCVVLTLHDAGPNKTSELEADEPITTSGWLCSFKNLEVTTANLDMIILEAESPSRDLHIVTSETRVLQRAKMLADNSANINEFRELIEKQPHICLWEMLARTALECGNYELAEQAFVYCRNLVSVQFVKRIVTVNNETIRKAEIQAYLGNFDAAEDLYRTADRRDLALMMRRKLGDWHRVIDLLKSGGSVSDSHSTVAVDMQLEEAYNNLGDFYAEQQKWPEAQSYYQLAHNQDRILQCFMMRGDYDAMRHMLSNLPDNHAALLPLARHFANVGLCDDSLQAYVRCGKYKAIDSSIRINAWQTGMQLARSGNNIAFQRDLDTLLHNFFKVMLEKKEYLNCIELYRKSGYYLQAAQLLYKIARLEMLDRKSVMRVKKLFVLSGLLVEQHREESRNAARTGLQKTNESTAVLNAFLSEDKAIAAAVMNESDLLDNVWRSAEAFHFLAIAHRCLFTNDLESALRVAQLLTEYDVLDTVEVYSFLATVACAARAFQQASRAFVKLETCEGITKEQRSAFEHLALEIFTKYPPKDTHSTSKSRLRETDADSGSSKLLICVASGQRISTEATWICKRCKHYAIEREMLGRKACPLCHSPVTK